SASCVSAHPRSFFFLLSPRPPTPTLFPYTTLFRSAPHRPVPVPTRARSSRRAARPAARERERCRRRSCRCPGRRRAAARSRRRRSEEHTSELQSLTNLVCRLLLQKHNLAAGGLSSP